MQFNAHERPPAALRDVFKLYQKRSSKSLENDTNVIDFARGLTPEQTDLVIERDDHYDRNHLSLAFRNFVRAGFHGSDALVAESLQDVSPSCKVYECKYLPSLFVIPNLIPIPVQGEMLNRLLHRDLVQPTHKTNVHLHYRVTYPPDSKSFFGLDPSDATFADPLDIASSKPINVGQFLNKKLRWMTLGGQYDWSKKIYPDEIPPEFPADVSELLEGLFPDTKPEAAIVNIYSPSDTLALHRDVSEECENGLVSISIGCECLFVVGLEIDNCLNHAVLRLRSGDAVYMSGPVRFAWHGVPTILPSTCPAGIGDWPGEQYSAWKGWMMSKRVNLNVRQMK